MVLEYTKSQNKQSAAWPHLAPEDSDEEARMPTMRSVKQSIAIPATYSVRRPNLLSKNQDITVPMNATPVPPTAIWYDLSVEMPACWKKYVGPYANVDPESTGSDEK